MKKIKFLITLILIAFTTFSFCGCNSDLYVNLDKNYSSCAFLPGAKWLDSEGNVIQAHGGQVQRMPIPTEDGQKEEKYVWIGENKTSGHLGNAISVYISDDLYSWECKGDVMRSVAAREDLDTDTYFSKLYSSLSEQEKDHVYDCIGTHAVIERPKMLYNAKTEQYVIWFHNDNSTELNSYKYDVGMSGIAISDSPFGPFRFLERYKLNECPNDQIDCYPSSKGEARDMNLFQDTDGTAYIVYSSENNKTLYISKLNENYTALSTEPSHAVYEKDYIRLFPGAMREAPVLFKNNGRYYLMSSSTTGWMSNGARVWSADSIFGEWRSDGNPCHGIGASITYDTQSTSIFQAKNGQWIYYGDRWNGKTLNDSRYIWLPVSFEKEKCCITWQTEWSLN